MRLLLDTNVLLWWVNGDPALPRRAVAAIENPDHDCLVSLVSAWEMAIKASIGKLTLPAPVGRFFPEQAQANRFAVLGIDLAHIARSEHLEPHHRDPFDRLLIAQALEERLPVVTADPVFRRYGVQRIW